jgi:hypothetical protein
MMQLNMLSYHSMRITHSNLDCPKNNPNKPRRGNPYQPFSLDDFS